MGYLNLHLNKNTFSESFTMSPSPRIQRGLEMSVEFMGEGRRGVDGGGRGG